LKEGLRPSWTPLIIAPEERLRLSLTLLIPEIPGEFREGEAPSLSITPPSLIKGRGSGG